MSAFNFKKFKIHHQQSFKVGTDGVLLGAWIKLDNPHTILDIGSGSGLIPLILAQRTNSTVIKGVEIDDLSFEESVKNVEESPWSDRVEILHDSVQSFSDNTATKFDLIVSNPPFFNNSVKSSDKKKAIARHTDKLSFEDLIDVANKHLTEVGKLAVVLPKVEGENFIQLASSKGLYLNRLTEVSSKKDKPVERLLMEFSENDLVLEQDKLIIQFEKRNDYTPGYIELTKDFYTIM
jgi:tRNA1Val (adenine37-N6)-methyltransferase